jgi:outer membrane protein assembly factor BamE (lipoprotein component of BamABCDE complex)
MNTLGGRAAVALAALAFAGASTGASSCGDASKDLDKAQKDLKDISGQNNAQYRDKIKQVKIGMSKAEVRAIMGRPRDVQKFESTYGNSESWYYGSYQLNFEAGKLESKNKY